LHRSAVDSAGNVALAFKPEVSRDRSNSFKAKPFPMSWLFQQVTDSVQLNRALQLMRCAFEMLFSFLEK
jgi:hypothetical protein